MAQVVLVCISEKKVKKHPVAEISLRPHHGIVGDAHAGDWQSAGESARKRVWTG